MEVVSKKRVPKRISYSNWHQFANLESKNTTRGLLSSVYGIEVMYALTSTHVFVYVVNRDMYCLINHAELVKVSDLWHWIGDTVSREFESIASNMYAEAVRRKGNTK